MDYSDITIPQGLYRSQLPKWFAVCFSIAAVLALPGVILLFSREYQNFLIQDLYLGGIVEASAANTWHLIESLITVVHFLCCAVLACSLVLALTSKFHRGIHILSIAAQWLLYGLHGGGILALCVLAFRLIRYIFFAVQINGGSYLIYSMLISEGMMVALAFLIYTLLRRFLNTSLDTIVSIGYTISSGKLDSHSISSFPAAGLIGLSVVCLVLSINHVYTLTIIDSFPRDYYKILIAERPGQYLAAASLVFCAIGNLLTAIYLRQYKRKDERFRYSLRKEIMDDIRK
jgi:hypothetical protein